MEETKDIVSDFNAFIAEADNLADAFATTGEDDNSYDAGALREDAAGKLRAYQSAGITRADAMTWLARAREDLDNIG